MPRTTTPMIANRLLLLVLLLAASGCRNIGTETAAEGPLAWTQGRWEGVRIDGEDGSEAPMTMTVEPILGGAGLIEHLEVEPDGGTYRGFAVQVFDKKLGRWVRQYVNAVRGRFVRLEGEVDGRRCVWRSVTPGRTRESRTVCEEPAPGRWRRTHSFSEDGGETWIEMWRDELRRIE